MRRRPFSVLLLLPRGFTATGRPGPRALKSCLGPSPALFLYGAILLSSPPPRWSHYTIFRGQTLRGDSCLPAEPGPRTSLLRGPVEARVPGAGHRCWLSLSCARRCPLDRSPLPCAKNQNPKPRTIHTLLSKQTKRGLFCFRPCSSYPGGI